MKVYIIKYALTKGIFEAEAEPGPFDGCVTVGKTMYNRSDWAGSATEARIRAEQMKQQKIRMLEKRVDKLKTTDFVTIRDYKYLKV